MYYTTARKPAHVGRNPIVCCESTNPHMALSPFGGRPDSWLIYYSMFLLLPFTSILSL